jgi:hypothetical protein
MKKVPDDPMRPEYDFSAGVRGKYADRLAGKPCLIELDDDVRKVFPDAASVNAALRALVAVVAAAKPTRRSSAIRRKTPRMS